MSSEPDSRNRWKDKVIQVLSLRDTNGSLTSRESSEIEFKEHFNFESLAKYLKTLAAFSNAHGGAIIYGVSDSPRKPNGINREHFEAIKQEKVSQYIKEYFDPYIDWGMNTISFQEQCFGYFYVNEARRKPILCKKTCNELKEGEIYFRYRGQSRVIGFSELRQIIDEVIMGERDRWMSLIERIAKIGPDKAAILDIENGLLGSAKGRNLLISRNILDELKSSLVFVDAGRFSENEGKPALQIVGNVIPTGTIISSDFDPQRQFPYIERTLAKALNLSTYSTRVMIWKLNIKNDSRFALRVLYGEKSTIYRYSELAKEKILTALSLMKDSSSQLESLAREYHVSVYKNEREAT